MPVNDADSASLGKPVRGARRETNIRVGRIYDEAGGHRILVDRLWPRGVAKVDAPWHEWRKDLAPSTQLRKAVHAGDLPPAAFRAAYLQELAALPESVRTQLLSKPDVVLVTASRDVSKSHAAVLRDWLESAGAPKPSNHHST